MKNLICATTITLVLATGAFAQGPRPNPGRGLQAALGLTETQTAAIKSIVQNAQPTLQADQTAIKQDRQLFTSLVGGASPIPADVGNAAIALHNAETKLQTDETAVIDLIKQQLTPDQLQKLDTIEAAGGGRGQSLLALGQSFARGNNRSGRGR